MKKLWLILALVGLQFVGCSKSEDLKSISIMSAEIIRDAADLLESTKARNLNSGGKISGTEIYINTTESKKFLESKRNILQENYKKIEKVYLSKNDNSFDALCVMAVLNEYTYFLSMAALDEPCVYAIKLNNLKNDNSPSAWVLNEFFYTISNPPWFQDSNLKKMSQSEKYEKMIESLMVTCEEGN